MTTVRSPARAAGDARSEGASVRVFAAEALKAHCRCAGTRGRCASMREGLTLRARGNGCSMNVPCASDGTRAIIDGWASMSGVSSREDSWLTRVSRYDCNQFKF